MRIGQVQIAELEFPGRAGELQRGKATAALVRELGRNYARYHAFLARELDRIDRRPGRKEMDQGFDVFLAAWDRLNDVLHGEALLRVCRAHELEGGALDAAADMTHPLVDEEHRLVSIETGRPLAGTTAKAAAREWQPLPRDFAY
jgi:hypothetical protein